MDHIWLGLGALGLFAAVRALALRTPPTRLSRAERRHLHAMELEEEEADRVYGSDDVPPARRG